MFYLFTTRVHKYIALTIVILASRHFFVYRCPENICCMKKKWIKKISVTGMAEWTEWPEQPAAMMCIVAGNQPDPGSNWPPKPWLGAELAN